MENKKKGLPRSILMMMLNDKDTGAPLAMMSANLLSSYRTGEFPVLAANIWQERLQKQSLLSDRVLWGKLPFVPLSA